MTEQAMLEVFNKWLENVGHPGLISFVSDIDVEKAVIHCQVPLMGDFAFGITPEGMVEDKNGYLKSWELVKIEGK